MPAGMEPVSADDALHDLFDGATIMLGGFVDAGHPVTLIRALQRRGNTRLTVIANNIGFGDAVDELCERRQVAKAIVSFAIRATATRPSRFEAQWRRRSRCCWRSR